MTDQELGDISERIREIVFDYWKENCPNTPLSVLARKLLDMVVEQQQFADAIKKGQ